MNWQYIKDRAKEKTTWYGLTAILTAFGVALTPMQVEAVIAAGTALAGAIGIFTKETPTKPQ